MFVKFSGNKVLDCGCYLKWKILVISNGKFFSLLIFVWLFWGSFVLNKIRYKKNKKNDKNW